jgi:hypothetical protein
MSNSRKRIKQNPSLGNKNYLTSLGRINEPPLPISNSHGEIPERLSHLSIDYQLTVRFRVSEIQRREVSLLLSVLTYRAVKFGVTFSDYLGLEHCYNFLIGNKGNPWEIRDSKERLTVLTILTVLKNLRGNPLYLEDRMMLQPEIIEELEPLLIGDRQYGSLKQLYNANRYLELRAVPLEVFYERNENTVRYDSYTRGYKDGGSSAPKKKTRYSSELDGEDSEPELVFPIMEYRKYQTIQFLNLRRFPKRDE